MIDAKNLAKAMKSAAKGGGYKIFAPMTNGNLYLWTNQWCVVLSADKVHRLVLAQIVEATGDLPKIGICGIVTEEGLQTLLPETAEAECRALTHEDTATESAVKEAPIRYRGFLIYQNELGKVYATTGAGISIIERSAAKNAFVSEERRLFYTAPDECLILPARRPVKDPETPEQELQVWAALESCALGAVE